MTNNKSQNAQQSQSNVSQNQQAESQKGQGVGSDNQQTAASVPNENTTLKDAHSIGYGRSDSGLDTNDTEEE